MLAKATEQSPAERRRNPVGQRRADLRARILLPRLERFALQFPDLRLRIDTSQRLVDLTLDDFDIAIRFAPMKKPAPNWTLLATETLVPVCEPAVQGATRQP